jgi:hypothetical protein
LCTLWIYTDLQFLRRYLENFSQGQTCVWQPQQTWISDQHQVCRRWTKKIHAKFVFNWLRSFGEGAEDWKVKFTDNVCMMITIAHMVLSCCLGLGWLWSYMVVGFKTNCAISAYYHKSCEFESHWWWGVLHTTLCDKVCQWLVTGRWFSPGTPVSSTNKTDCHNITEYC